MKTSTSLGLGFWLFLGVACGGTSSLGQNGSGAGEGDAGGMEPPGPNECGDCVVPEGPCQICADGTAACPTAGCVDGECTVEMPTCGGGMDPQCETDSDCGMIGAPCEMCPDGTAACPKTWCDNGSCTAVFPSCEGGGMGGYEGCEGKQCGESCDLCNPMDPNCAQADLLLSCDAYGRCGPGMPQCEPPSTLCMTAMDCPQSLAPCEICPDGSAACPFTDCINGACVATFSTCSGTTPGECQSDYDCPQSDAPCQMCPDGTSACPGAFCAMGQCVFSFPACGGTGGYDPCANKACGDSCSLCAPDDPDCIETDEVKTCGPDGLCHGGPSACMQ